MWQPEVGILAAHLVEEHLVSPGVALKEARQAVPPPEPAAPTTPPAPTPAPPSPIAAPGATVAQTNGRKEARPMAKGCTYCKRTNGTHTAGCRLASGCKLCAKRAPEKCAYHGGSSLTFANRRGGQKPAAPSGRPAGLVPETAAARALLIEHLEVELEHKRAELRVLEGLLQKAQARA
jgi:hypothetical protein